MRHRYLSSTLARQRAGGGDGAALTGTLYAGDDQIIIGGGQETLNLNATYTGDTTDGITFTWSQTAGGTGTFGNVNSLSTTFTTETTVDSDISLLITAVRGAFTLTDGLNVTVNPFEQVSAIRLTVQSMTELTYFVASNLSINPEGVGQNLPFDTIFWTEPSLNSVPTYTGYQIQNVTTGQIVESGSRGTFRYTITDNDQYQYLPVFETGTGRQIVGTSDGPFIKSQDGGGIALVEVIKDNVIRLNAFDSDTVTRIVSTRALLEPVENTPAISLTAVNDSDSVSRISFTKAEGPDLGTDSVSNIIRLNAFPDSDNVFRLAYTLATLPV